MSHSRLASLMVLLLVSAGCAGGSSTDTEASESTVQATLNDDMTIALSETEFSVGETVVFEVTNAGEVTHELYLGDEAAQAEHADEMAEMGGIGHDEPSGVSVEPGATEQLEYTFTEAGEILGGCHEPGHYEAGMVTALTVTK